MAYYDESGARQVGFRRGLTGLINDRPYATENIALFRTVSRWRELGSYPIARTPTISDSANENRKVLFHE